MKYFNLFSNILITKGAGRILISDLQRNVSELYPLELYEITEDLKKYSIENMMNDYDEDSKNIIQEYLDILLEKEYGFITENDWNKNFPPLSHEYHEPSLIADIFMEMDDISLLEKIKPSIENLGVKHLTIYSTKTLSAQDIINIDKTFETSVLSGIEIFSPFKREIDQTSIKLLHNHTSRIYNIIFYNCPAPHFKAKDEYRFTLHYIEEDLKISSCGKVDLKYFNTNLPKVLEAINHNSCLHKKIGIDKAGNIKNCPLMKESFGNMENSTLEEVIEQPGFKKYWSVTKDLIETCKDCEFRYVCTDCRAYTEDALKKKQSLDTSKPLKCGYNPYICKWEDWAANPLKTEIIHLYDLTGIQIT
ncbi:grasp-with-spasm system SPASM domain peptide maturase [Chryseobacterium sp. Tr-659]|uniref:grasp-with-spasm system SPASM domain peptide maturase n=1 Tax=Chryseobacterium sp. Tr-659 TaxID=2608340 RepID=UPI0014218939|nr:grasp-with-spasm system SPASM domain peptide maturase [Chryseobacterium sp. Tr-659]NIF07404.1 grasp-with-spasm system SPASM domain peptide maturase [Chryseobacterium sp. Tr-659]